MSIAQHIYDRSPVTLQNALLSSYGMYLNLFRYHRSFQRYLDFFSQSQWWSHEQIGDYQNKRLADVIDHAYHTVPYYRKLFTELGLKPKDITTKEDLAKLPVLTREDVKSHFHELLSTTLTRKDRFLLVKGHTSGTTGAPLEFYWDRNLCTVNNAIHWRQKNWAGIALHEKTAVLLGRTIVPIHSQKPPFWRYNRPHRTLWLSSFHLTLDNLPLYADALEHFKPSYIEGYPSTLFILAKFLSSRGRMLSMKAALTSSETLFPIQRETIENAFACRVFDYYGLAERVVFASECAEHTGHHLNSDFSITELLDSRGNSVATGDIGWIVGTGLHNYAMPLIRYKSNDVTSIKPTQCACGRCFPLMEDVTTKAEDIVTTKDGRFISSSVLTHPFKPLVNIAESQIIQEDLENLRIKIVRNRLYSDQDSAELIAAMQKRVGSEMKIHLEFVDYIPRTPSGKFRWVISKVPLDIH